MYGEESGYQVYADGEYYSCDGNGAGAALFELWTSDGQPIATVISAESGGYTRGDQAAADPECRVVYLDWRAALIDAVIDGDYPAEAAAVRAFLFPEDTRPAG